MYSFTSNGKYKSLVQNENESLEIGSIALVGLYKEVNSPNRLGSNIAILLLRTMQIPREQCHLDFHKNYKFCNRYNQKPS